MLVPGCRLWHTLFTGYQIHAQGNVAGGGQATDPVRRGALEAGLNEICFVTGRGKRAIEDHFDLNYELEHQIAGTGKEKYLESIRHVMDSCSFSFTRQREMKGLGHAILTGRRLVGENAFGVILSDDLCMPAADGAGVMAQMVKLYKQFRCSIVAIQEVDGEDIEKFGVIEGEKLKENIFRVSNMVEKPKLAEAPSNMAIIGRYILTPDIFDILEKTPPGKGGEVQLTDALLQQAQEGAVLAYRFKGTRYDCGSVEGYVEATQYVYENIYRKPKA